MKFKYDTKFAVRDDMCRVFRCPDSHFRIEPMEYKDKTYTIVGKFGNEIAFFENGLVSSTLKFHARDELPSIVITSLYTGGK